MDSSNFPETELITDALLKPISFNEVMKEGHFHLSNWGNARRLVARHGEDIRYNCVTRKWLRFDNRRWVQDDTGEVDRIAKETIVSMHEEAAAANNDALSDHALKSENGACLNDMIRLASSEPGIPVKPEQLDADGWLLNVQNGTINLRTGELGPHDRTNLITKMAPLDFDPDSNCPVWERFIEKIMDKRVELVGFLQKMAGYALTGDMSEQCIFFLYGKGANGKSTFLRTLLSILDSYGKQAAPDLLLTYRGHTHPTGLADTAGTRLLVCSEIDEGRRLSEVLVKQMTGGDRQKARYMRRDFFEFEPTAKVLLAANHKPLVRGSDHAIWRRIRLIPFDVTIPEKEQDKTLVSKLWDERSGILNWMLKGCLEWQKNGLAIPKEIHRAVEEYRSEMDDLGNFIEACCITGLRVKVTAKELFAHYVKWAEGESGMPLTPKTFSSRLTERGFYKKREGHNNVTTWFGIGIDAKNN